MFDVCIALWAPGKRISCTQIKLAWSQWLICCSLRWCFLQLALYSYLAWWTPWAVLCIYDYINIYICIYISIRFTTDVIYYSHVLPQWQLFQCDFVLRGILAGDFIDFASGFIRWTALSGSGTVSQGRGLGRPSLLGFSGSSWSNVGHVQRREPLFLGNYLNLRNNTGNESNNLWNLISINVLWMGGRWAFIHSTCKLSDEKWCSRFWYIARLQLYDARVGKSHFLRNRNTFPQPLLEMRYLSGWNHRFRKLEDGNIEHPYICPIKEGFATDFPEKSIISIHRPLPSLRTELCEATNCRMFGWLTGATTSVERGTWLWLVSQNWFYLLNSN